MKSDYKGWDEIYRSYPLEELGWELGKPRPILVEFLEKGRIKNGRALDVCCGLGTNTIYLASNGFEVTGIDISSKAIEYVKHKAEQSNVKIDLITQSFTDISFQNETFDFIFDMGCFHHVYIEDRQPFIRGIHRVLKKEGKYLLTCFSYKNGPGWNHFTKDQLINLFSDYFALEELRHYGSIEGDGVKRFFYSILMKKD